MTTSQNVQNGAVEVRRGRRCRLTPAAGLGRPRSLSRPEPLTSSGERGCTDPGDEGADRTWKPADSVRSRVELCRVPAPRAPPSRPVRDGRVPNRKAETTSLVLDHEVGDAGRSGPRARNSAFSPTSRRSPRDHERVLLASRHARRVLRPGCARCPLFADEVPGTAARHPLRASVRSQPWLPNPLPKSASGAASQDTRRQPPPPPNPRARTPPSPKARTPPSPEARLARATSVLPTAC
jgi:hypothetical protein